MGMLLRRRNATAVKEGKTTKAADVTPVVEKKSKKDKEKDDNKSEK